MLSLEGRETSIIGDEFAKISNIEKENLHYSCVPIRYFYLKSASNVVLSTQHWVSVLVMECDICAKIRHRRSFLNKPSVERFRNAWSYFVASKSSTATSANKDRLGGFCTRQTEASCIALSLSMAARARAEFDAHSTSAVTSQSARLRPMQPYAFETTRTSAHLATLCGISSHLWHAFLWHKSHILAPRRSHHTRIRSCASLTPRYQKRLNVPTMPENLHELAERVGQYAPIQKMYIGHCEDTNGGIALMFMHPDMREPLKECTALFGDGTFKRDWQSSHNFLLFDTRQRCKLAFCIGAGLQNCYVPTEILTRWNQPFKIENDNADGNENYEEDDSLVDELHRIGLNVFVAQDETGDVFETGVPPGQLIQLAPRQVRLQDLPDDAELNNPFAPTRRGRGRGRGSAGGGAGGARRGAGGRGGNRGAAAGRGGARGRGVARGTGERGARGRARGARGRARDVILQDHQPPDAVDLAGVEAPLALNVDNVIPAAQDPPALFEELPAAIAGTAEAPLAFAAPVVVAAVEEAQLVIAQPAMNVMDAVEPVLEQVIFNQHEQSSNMINDVNPNDNSENNQHENNPIRSVDEILAEIGSENQVSSENNPGEADERPVANEIRNARMSYYERRFGNNSQRREGEASHSPEEPSVVDNHAAADESSAENNSAIPKKKRRRTPRSRCELLGCREKFHVLKLSCGHRFCVPCIKNFLTRECAHCRRPIGNYLPPHLQGGERWESGEARALETNFIRQVHRERLDLEQRAIGLVFFAKGILMSMYTHTHCRREKLMARIIRNVRPSGSGARINRRFLIKQTNTLARILRANFDFGMSMERVVGDVCRVDRINGDRRS
ncbi:unnamed protein product [Trichogramma brassicae]|uniref:RING-type domain-containing protein n=1 Tax=Trichogramma brassicae TaxID=86971 RepID=A0A6H5HYE1_9HYME|nr:unnamed protein product [Trichogramma brassicae]